MGVEKRVGAGPRHLRIADYTYDLREDRVPQYPLAERDASKLLVYREGNITEGTYKELAEHIPSGAFMVFNDTKVIGARLLFRKETGGQVEVFCLEPLDAEPSRAMAQQGSATWKCLVGGAGKWKTGTLVREMDGVRLEAEKTGQVADGYAVRLSWVPANLHFAEVLHRVGLVPLPPYLNRAPEATDAERYQTVYARFDGSVAAPTAGLHVTQAILDNLREKGVTADFVTLHVGAGTFKPVKAEFMEDHVMHAEWMDVTTAFIKKLKDERGPVIPVGTTALRTLESLYWMGVKALSGAGDLSLSQWEVYEALPPEVPRKEALEGLLDWLHQRQSDRIVVRTQLLIAPGYRPRIADALVTNFHQPGSTLLLLVAALIGEDWKMIYKHALDHAFRFLSYGDGSLLWLSRGPDAFY